MFPLEFHGEVNHEEIRVTGYSVVKVAWSQLQPFWTDPTV